MCAMKTKMMWVLGAPDPEMEQIEQLLNAVGETVVYATKDGKRVTPDNAYKANGVIRPDGTRGIAAPADYWVLVECLVDVDKLKDDVGRYDGFVGVETVDHHRPGDRGYGRPPTEFLQASSIGQVIYMLAYHEITLPWQKVGWRTSDDGNGANYNVTVSIYSDSNYITQINCQYPHWMQEIEKHLTDMGVPVHAHAVGDIAIGGDRRWYVCVKDFSTHGCEEWMIIPRHIVHAAAADHCLAAAYRGECPGVDPDDLMRWRVATRARHQGRAQERNDTSAHPSEVT